MLMLRVSLVLMGTIKLKGIKNSLPFCTIYAGGEKHTPNEAMLHSMLGG